ncbi:MAG: orotate phosphoribosyltransferase [Candidatus Methanoperedens sp.]|nr:orotate phosphoribosyltransferase [Candidatus Methanoperedens sp.]MCZ7359599.1 orotate phosphoribosyltransferase [Candidatus Methanoperedens sp.]HLB72252.1 orotate phosphoribosyltransferase [Candidatus Methanoperedens sp.]
MNIADVLKESGAIKFGDFILASGKKSRYYIDIKKASTNPKILKMMACQISEMMKLHSISADYIAGVALGGVPIAVAVSLETGIPFVMIRKEVKEYGTKGQIVGDPERGKSAVLVEDVTTSGDSVLKALKILRDEGLEVRHVVVVVDREEGALKALAHADVEFIPLIRISELYNDL